MAVFHTGVNYIKSGYFQLGRMSWKSLFGRPCKCRFMCRSSVGKCRLYRQMAGPKRAYLSELTDR